MGYRLKTRTVTLDFGGTEWDGAVIKMRCDVSLREWTDYFDIRNNKPLDEVCEMAGGLLISWNLDDRAGKTLPCTAEGYRDIPDKALAVAILDLWEATIRGLVKIDTPLEEPSNDGTTSTPPKSARPRKRS